MKRLLNILPLVWAIALTIGFAVTSTGHKKEVKQLQGRIDTLSVIVIKHGEWIQELNDGLHYAARVTNSMNQYQLSLIYTNFNYVANKMGERSYNQLKREWEDELKEQDWYLINIEQRGKK